MKYSEQDAIRSIQKCFEMYHDIDSRIYRKSKLKPSISYILRNFGSWNYNVRKSGFIPKRNREDEELLRQFRETIEKLGYVPSSHEYNQLSLNPGLVLFESRGFTWDDLLQESGLSKKTRPYQDMKQFEKPCEVCGKIMKFTAITISTRKYCDDSCKNIAMKRRKKN